MAERDYPDDIHARVPVNATAERVTRPGTPFVSRKRILTADSELPLPTRLIPPGVTDLRQREFGWFTVLGLAADGGGWVVRCRCGMYTKRRQRAILNPTNAQVDRCERCRQTAYLRRTATFRHCGHNSEA